MNMQTQINIIKALDSEIKNLRELLQQLSAEERILYVKKMIPVLLSMPQKITASSQRITDKHQTPFTSLSAEQKNLIDRLGNSTDDLYDELGGDTIY